MCAFVGLKAINMAKKKNTPSVQTVAVRNNNTGQVKMAKASQPTMGVAGTTTNMLTKKKQSPANTGMMPNLSLASRYNPYIAMCIDPVHAAPSLPPTALVARAVPLKQYQEILLSTDSNGNAAAAIYPRMYSQYFKALTFTGTTIATVDGGNNNTEAVSFSTNFYQYVPLVMEVQMRYTGSSNVVSGRMYGIVSPSAVNSTSFLDVTSFPLEPNGCEAVTADGISCVWYSTDPVWGNPTASNNTGAPSEWGDTQIIVSLVGGPASVTNLLTIGVYLHMAAIPRIGICGLTPLPSFPDPSVSAASSLLSMSSTGLGASSTSIPDRNKHKSKWKGHVKDVIRVGGQTIGTVFPHLGQAASVAEALSLLLL